MRGRKGKAEVAWNLAEAKKLRAAGATWRDLAIRYGIDAETAHRRCDPEYHLKRNRDAAANAAKYRAAVKREIFTPVPPRQNMNPIPAPRYDTRSLTAVMMGDPHPERSALATRSA